MIQEIHNDWRVICWTNKTILLINVLLQQLPAIVGVYSLVLLIIPHFI